MKHRGNTRSWVSMLADYGETVIVDWGLAKVQDKVSESTDGEISATDVTVHGVRQDTPGSGHKTQIGELLGTPVYMSPEQAKGLPADERSDIYSLGAVLYEILTGKTPFSGKTIDEIIAHVIHDAPDSIEDALPKSQRYLILIVQKALAKDPADRYETAHALGVQVDEHNTAGMFLNPLRPNLLDRVPELKSLSTIVQAEVNFEAYKRFKKNKKMFWRSFLTDLGWISILLIIMGSTLLSVFDAEAIRNRPKMTELLVQNKSMQATIERIDPSIPFPERDPEA